MSHYIDTIRKPPKSMTEAEQHRLLTTSGNSADGFRDHVIFAVALGTALRAHEILALNVGDIHSRKAGIRQRVPLTVFKRSNTDVSAQEVILPDALRFKLAKFMRWKAERGERLDLDAPLFVSRDGDNARLSDRSLRSIFGRWQERAGLERSFTFHSLRHTALTNLYRSTKDIRLVQRVARHASVESTTIYAGASDEDVLRAVSKMPC